MSGYILCQTKKAEQPYFVENISTNIYSIEELCYYLYHNLYLIDKTIINEGLCTWLEKQLGMEKLAAKLRPHLGKFAGAEEILYPIFKEINYLTYEELRILNSQLTKMDTESPLLREKKKGDSLVENGMYAGAIRVYQKLLESSGTEEVREGFTAGILRNLGCAYAYLFQLEKAAQCFKDAYERSGNEEDLTRYLLAMHEVLNAKEYKALLKDQKISSEISAAADALLKNFSEPSVQEISMEEADAILDRCTKEYHRSTGS